MCRRLVDHYRNDGTDDAEHHDEGNTEEDAAPRLAPRSTQTQTGPLVSMVGDTLPGTGPALVSAGSPPLQPRRRVMAGRTG